MSLVAYDSCRDISIQERSQRTLATYVMNPSRVCRQIEERDDKLTLQQ